MFRKLGWEKPNVGIMAAVESVKDSMPATVDAQKLTEMNENGVIKNCSVYGPLALDIAVSREAALHKKIDHPVAGNVDIMIMPNIESGNVFYKANTKLAKGEQGAIVVGARVPAVLSSRGDSIKTKLYSIALAALTAK